MKMNKYSLLISLCIGGFSNVIGQTYPFTLPATVTASLNVTTGVTEPANNLLLGLNFSRFTSSSEKTIFRYLNPVTVRFPSGVWSNWYDWTIDRSTYKREVSPGVWEPYDNYDIGDTHRNAMDTWERSDTKTGFPGLKSLFDEKAFNVVWTYNLNYDSNEKSVARLQDSDAKGFNVGYIELGNEQFWKDQRSERISTPEKYYPIAVSLSQALKVAKPSLKLSVPLSWRESHASYNNALTLTTGYFDAISLHKYVEYEKEVAVKATDTYKHILTARLKIENSKNWVQSYAPGKKIWMTEWGVSCDPMAASYLGQADAYLYLFEKQNAFERAEWYGATTELNPLYYFTDAQLDGGGRPLKVLSNMRKTGFGAVYEILRSVFENSTLLKSDMTCNATLTAPKDTNYAATLPVTVDAVSARAVTKNGATAVFVVNKTPKSVVFDLKLDNVSYTGTFKHEALSFTSLSDAPTFANNEDPLTLIKSGSGVITLPPYSVNKLSEIASTPPPPIYPGTYNGIKNVPGQIEIEDYNLDKNVGFYDTTDGNSGGAYRTAATDDVDITTGGTGFVSTAIAGDEYTRYTIRVTQSGSYHMKVNYKTSSTTSKPFSAYLLPVDLSSSTLLFTSPSGSTTEGIVKIGTTAVFQDYQSPNFNLIAGDYVLELKIPAGGAGPNYDYVTLVRDGAILGVNDFDFSRLKLFPNPSTDGVFYLTEELPWEVYNLSGAKLLAGKGMKIDLSAFTKGIYFIQTAKGSTKVSFQ
ncbi:T9SS type A sorting domain-containing protein [Flavobacterium faecale]|uniref:T9SS type A sorting domain-containing protein n=1 Tax=Flavobacterium faecale TaxID=1355330 RepID=UPI003AAA5097